jgi:hypothetical protein
MAKIVPPETQSLSTAIPRASLGKLAVRRAFCAVLAATLATTAYALSTITASTSSANPVPISAVGSPMLRAGYLGASSFGETVPPAYPGDLFVLAVINDTWADQVTAVSGGDVTSWHPAARPFFDGSDGQMLQIWYGQVSSTSPTTLSIAWNGTINNADVALEEFSAGANATWSLVSNGISSVPFPALSSPARGALYFGAATAWGNGAAGATPGVTYSVPNGNFLVAWNTNSSGTVAPAATGAGSVAALFNATAAPAAPVAPTSSTSTVAPTTTATSPPLTSIPPALQWPGSIFNDDVRNWPLDVSSAEFVQDVVTDYMTDYGAVGVNTMPIYTVPANQAEATISVTPGCTDFTVDTGTEIPIPSYAALTGFSDSPLVIYQPSTGTDWEFWQLTRLSASSYDACWGGRLSLATSDGVFPAPYGLSATGISYLATTITEADVESGSIDHAIAVALPRCNHWVYPASRTDCGADLGQPAEGQWFRFAAGTTCAPSQCSTPFAQMVFKAIQTYGMVVVDQAGAVMLEAEQPSDWAAEGNSGTNPITASWDGLEEYQVVANLPWSSLQAVDPPR